jgi:hypothetical protein
VLSICDANRCLYCGFGVFPVLGNVEQVINTCPFGGSTIGCKVGPQAAVGVVDGREDQRGPGLVSGDCLLPEALVQRPWQVDAFDSEVLTSGGLAFRRDNHLGGRFRSALLSFAKRFV